jgi:hypothetical protein
MRLTARPSVPGRGVGEGVHFSECIAPKGRHITANRDDHDSEHEASREPDDNARCESFMKTLKRE